MVPPEPRRYRSADEDSGRWDRFRFRDGDIVVSTRSKSGTTWVQMICALLVFGRPDLPAPLGELSPWIDHEIEPIDDVVAALEEQPHRRFVKTHTPLDGIPLDDRATYLVVARHPLDMAVSLYHQGDNIDRARLAELTGSPVRATAPRPSAHDWLVQWMRTETTAAEQMDSLVGVVHHADDAWSRRGRPNIVLVHYADLQADLDGQMRRLARRLRVDVAEERWPALVEAAGFGAMRRQVDLIAPNPLGVLKDNRRFFRSGRSGEGRALLDADEQAEYDARLATLAPSDVLEWLNR